ncbi:MAG: T9SS type A sorting domain-containing protein [Bacteroidales bacterium]|nr:T9SS type A sorting domain-containing protein [Bacteroidales bacterium]
MKRIANFSKFIFAILSLLITANLWGQTLSLQNPSAANSENNPYLITSAADWNTFVTDVNNGYSYSGKYVKLTNDITISDIAGTWTNRTTYKAFSGTFEGDGHIITFNKGEVGNATNEALCAPFRVIDGATIKNLNTEGTIVSRNKYAGGLSGYAYGTTKISNCISNINITSTLTGNGDATHGGFIGQQEAGRITFEDCIFEGSITGATAKKAAGFMGWRGGTVTYTNCIQAGTLTMGNNTATYHRGTNGGGTFDNAYYIIAPAHPESYGLQGDAYASSAEAPTDDIYRKYTNNTNNYYFPGVVVTGLENTMYTYQEGHPVEITPVVKYYCRTLTRGTDYDIKLDGTLVSIPNTPTINTSGNHTITIEGKTNYVGSHTVVIVAISGAGTEADPYQIPSATIWDAFAAAVSGGSTQFNDKFYKLTADIEVSEMVGTDENPFKGTFIGKNGETKYTLTFNKGTNETPFDEEYCAPFRYIDGATIKDLNIAGAIYSSKDRASGLIGKSSGTSTVQDVTVSANIIATGKDLCSGFAVEAANLNLTRCIYDGKLVANENCAGFCASGSGTKNINNCLFKPAAETSVSKGSNLVSGSGNITITGGYYTYKIGSSDQGYQAYTSQPAKVLSKKMNLMDGNDYYVDGKAEIDGVEDFYTYTGNAITVTNTVKFFGATLAAANYTVSITLNDVASTVVNRGDYKLTVSGETGNNYYGSTYTEFSVVSDHLSGEGTESSPYLITSEADWNVFAERVGHGLDVRKYYQLTDNISVSEMVGTNSNRFKGTFDGNWHKITFTKGSAESPFNEDYCAPFRYVEDATIMNLTVDGTIISAKKYVGGLIGYFYASSKGNIVNCTSSVNINCSHISGDCYYGGFAGEIRSSESGYLRFRNCMFDGSILDGKTTKDTEICSGFIGNVIVPQGIDFTRDMIYVNCCMNGTISVKGKTANFHRGSKVPTLFYHTYYLINNTDDEAAQGVEAPTEAPANYISKKYDNRYVPAAVILSLETVAGGKAPVMALYGSKLTRGTDFSVSATSNPYTINGENGNNFYGSVTTRIVDNWTDLNAALKINGIVDLVADVTAGPSDGSLVVSGNRTVTLNLNGHTVDRHLSASANLGHVFRIEKNNTLTINGNGTITGGYNKGTGAEFDGGGIYNLGTLTLNSVYISGNRCLKKDGEDASGRGGGVFSGTESSLTMNGCYVTGNTAEGGGGGVYGQDASVFVLDDDYFYQNVSESKGGGVRVRTKDNVTASITNSNIVGNFVTAYEVVQAAQGGGIYMEAGNLYMENNAITGNTSNLQGSGLYQNKGTITAKNCEITINGSYMDNVNSQGAGAYLYSGTFTMDGGLITGNNAYAGTGGIYVNKGAKLQLTGNVTIFDNYVAQVNGEKSFKNVYIADPSSDGVIEILPYFDSKSKIAVFKNFSSDFAGVFTTGLYANGGTVANFVTDDASFEISQTGGSPNEAQFAAPKAWTDCVDGTDYNKTGDAEPFSYEILKPVSVVEGNVTANTISFSGEGCLYIQENSTLTAEFINNDDPVRLVIEDGGQVITTSENVEATVKKKTTQNKWYLISSAINNPYIEDNTNVITTEVPTSDPSITYDLYRFNEAATLQWENFRAGHGDFTRFTNGRGYLYRNSVLWGYTIIMEGTLNVGTRIGGGEEDNTWIVTYPLSYSGTNEFKGFHLIGNPYSHNIYKNDEYQAEGDAPAINDENLAVGYYVLNSAADAFEAKIGYNNPIKPCDGILVQTTSAHDLIITNTTNAAASYTPPTKSRGESGYGNITFEIANNEYSDVAYAMFIDGAGLNKIEHMNEDVPMLYIHQDDESYAIATLSKETKAFDLHFEAATMGRYTLSVKPQGEFSYLHLYDKVEGSDIDLLAKGEYSFIGMPSDSKDRFVVRLGSSGSSDGDQSFAYQSGNDIVVSGQGELQVFDLMGRMVMTQHIDGVQTMCTSSLQTGVYIFRLNEVSQKIVVK